jgi:hypothetical protein
MMIVARICRWIGDLTLMMALATAMTLSILKHQEVYGAVDPIMIRTIEPWAFPTGYLIAPQFRRAP